MSQAPQTLIKLAKRRACCAVRAISLAGLLCSAATADPTANRMQAGFDTWTATHKITSGSLALFKDGVLMNTPDPAPVELASLSKAITAVCVMHMVEDGAFSFDSDVSDLIGTGPEGLTVAQLLTHTGGVWPDTSQGRWSFARYGDDRAMHNALALLALDRGLDATRKNTFAYSNENYAILGAVIEARSKQPYEDTCAACVFAPAGVTAAPSADTHPFLAWGGWSMSTADYGRFHRHYFGPDSTIGRDPVAFPHVETGGGAYYGMGMVFRRYNDSHNFWHFGAWCLPGRLNVGSFSVSWENTWSAVAAYDGCLDWDQMGALDGALARAVYPR